MDVSGDGGAQHWLRGLTKWCRVYLSRIDYPRITGPSQPLPLFAPFTHPSIGTATSPVRVQQSRGARTATEGPHCQMGRQWETGRRKGRMAPWRQNGSLLLKRPEELPEAIRRRSRMPIDVVCVGVDVCARARPGIPGTVPRTATPVSRRNGYETNAQRRHWPRQPIAASPQPHRLLPRQPRNATTDQTPVSMDGQPGMGHPSSPQAGLPRGIRHPRPGEPKPPRSGARPAL